MASWILYEQLDTIEAAILVILDELLEALTAFHVAVVMLQVSEGASLVAAVASLETEDALLDASLAFSEAARVMLAQLQAVIVFSEGAVVLRGLEVALQDP